jgi:hypothetical protein
MKKNYLKLICAFLLTALFVSSCQKEIKETKQAISESELPSVSNKPKNECRLIATEAHDPVSFAYNTFHYNQAGLCDVWKVFDSYIGDQTQTQEYDANGRLIKAKWFIGADQITDIDFTYSNNRMQKETWYWVNSNDIYEEVWYTYNTLGQMVRNESFVNNWYAINKYSPEGNVLSTVLYFDGSPIWASIMTYTRQVKSPYRSVPGIDVFYAYYTPAFYDSKFRNAAEIEQGYDIDGTPILDFDYDPAKTIWQVGNQNYPLSTDCYDKLSGEWFNYSFEYENCGSDNGANHSIKVPQINGMNAKKVSIHNLLRRNPTMTVKEQLTKLRQFIRSYRK